MNINHAHDIKNEFGSNLIIEEPYPFINDYLKENINKPITAYMNFEGSQWNSKIFKGIIVSVGKDYLVIKDLHSELKYLLPLFYLNFLTIEDTISDTISDNITASNKG